jgi:DnaJ-class molecular chaperone
MDIQERREKIGDEPTDTKKYYMATCPDCGGRGHHTDDDNNQHKCYRCNGTGQVD